MKTAASRAWRRVLLASVIAFCLVPEPPAIAGPYRVGNQSISIELDLDPDSGVRISSITPQGGTGPLQPGPLFEFFPRCVSTADWCSNKIKQSDTLHVDPASIVSFPSLLRFSADSPDDHLRFDFALDARDTTRNNPGIILRVFVCNTVATPDGWAGPWETTAADSAPPESNLAVLRRSDNQVDAFYINRDGVMTTTFSVNNGPWIAETLLYGGHSGLFVAGGPVAAVRRGFTFPEVVFPHPKCPTSTDTETWWGCGPDCPAGSPARPKPDGCPGVSLTQTSQVDVFTVNPRDGRIWSSFEVLDSSWSDPFPLYADPQNQRLFPAGAHLFALRRSGQMKIDDPTTHDEILDVYAIGKDGRVYVTWERAGGTWSEPTPIAVTNEARFPPGAPIVALKRSEHRVDVFSVGADGRVWGAFRGRDRNVDLTWGEWQDWQPFAPLSADRSTRIAPSSFLAATRSGAGSVELFAFSGGGSLVHFEGSALGGWKGPDALSVSLAKPFSDLTAMRRTDQRIEVSFVDKHGDLEILARDDGWTGPRIVKAGFAPPGAHLAAVVRRAEGTDVPDQGDVLAFGRNGAVRVVSDLYGRTFLRLVLPKLHGLTNAPGVLGAVPDEIGGIAGFDFLHKDFTHPTGLAGSELWRSPRLGAQYIEATFAEGLPSWMNSMEMAAAYTVSDGGLFFFDMQGDVDFHVAPLQLVLNKLSEMPVGMGTAIDTCAPPCDELAGFWVRLLAPGEYVEVPAIGIGTIPPGKDWHVAADAYLKVHPAKPPLAPDWLRKAGAIYTFGQGGAGGIYLDGRTGSCPSLKDALKSFYRMDELLAQALELGTNVVYLWDYWEKGDPERRVAVDAPYFHKGDYLPRADLGGECAFIEGIRKVHEGGGKVILYVESLLVSEGQKIANQNLSAWAGRDLDCPRKGLPWKAYNTCDLGTGMLAPAIDWQEQLVAIAEKLVHDYGADGIFLDSGGFHMNRTKRSDEEQLTYSAKGHSQGVLELIDRVRDAVRRIKPDAVVLTETISGPAGWHADGGTSSDFFSGSWPHGETEIQGILRASPVRYSNPGRTWFSNGTDIFQLRQVFAAGHSLALSGNCAECPCRSPFIVASKAEIRRLVEIRRNYNDALVDGSQEYQPAASPQSAASPVVAYDYRGSANEIVTVVNTDPNRSWSGTLQLRPSDRASKWTGLLPTWTWLPLFVVNADSRARLALTLGPGQLKVFKKTGSGRAPARRKHSAKRNVEASKASAR